MTDSYLLPDHLWWDGRFHPGGILRRTDSGCAPVDTIPAGATELRMPGTLLPGLTDAHVHAALVDLGTVRAGGIAAVWDLGGNPDHLRSLRAGPRMTIAGQFLTAPGGYPSDRAWAPAGSWRAVHSADEGADAVAFAEQAGAGLIKVTLHAGGPMLPPPVVAAIVAAAHDRGLPVVVHAEGPGTVATALDVGADLLAHTPWTEPLDDGLVRACAGRMRWISTLDIHGYGSDTPALGLAVGNLRRFLGHGGTVLYGTDLGNGPLIPGINPREIRALQRAGLTPADVLAAMTHDADGLPPSWIPGGLDLDPARFADVLATARVAGPEVRPRHST